MKGEYTSISMQTQTLLNTILHELDNLKAINVVPISVKNLTPLTDYMVIASGNSGRHVNAIAQNLMRKLKEQDCSLIGFEGDTNNEWLLVDMGEVVVHIMQAQTRDFYQLEKLWSTHIHA